MGFEDKKDNKKENNLDTSRNGRPFSLSTGDGEDFVIDLPESIPGLGDINLDNLNEDKAKDLLAKLKGNSKEISDILKSVGIDDVSKFIEDNK